MPRGIYKHKSHSKEKNEIIKAKVLTKVGVITK